MSQSRGYIPVRRQRTNVDRALDVAIGGLLVTVGALSALWCVAVILSLTV
jgi:hypothetical protein